MSDESPLKYPTVCSYLITKDATKAIAFYTSVLGGEERMRLEGPGGTVMHAEIAFGNSVVMLADEFPDRGFVGPHEIGGTPVSLMLTVDDCDASHAQAIAAGAESIQDPADQFYGDRTSRFIDPFGHAWSLTTPIEQLTPAEVKRRMDEMLADGP